jgi:hypothetical protein
VQQHQAFLKTKNKSAMEKSEFKPNKVPLLNLPTKPVKKEVH